MNREQYKAAVDSMSFSPDFQARTKALLFRTARGTKKKEMFGMKHKTFWRAAVAVACVALLSISAVAAVRWLTPAQVADTLQEPKLAEAFSAEEAVPMNETHEMGEYLVRLMGTTTGRGLSVLNPEVDQTHTYAVLAAERKDGAPVDFDQFTAASFHVLPVVKGRDPLEATDLYTGVSVGSFAEGGFAYWLVDMEGLAQYAGQPISLAVYQGIAPTMFQMAEDGTVSFKDGYTEPHALFGLITPEE